MLNSLVQLCQMDLLTNNNDLTAENAENAEEGKKEMNNSDEERTWYGRFAVAHKRHYKPWNYKTPLELGIRLARRGSIATAIRKARANALNAASTM